MCCCLVVAAVTVNFGQTNAPDSRAGHRESPFEPFLKEARQSAALTNSPNPEVAQREKLFQRLLKEERESMGLTNAESNVPDFLLGYTRAMFDQMIVHPSFGLHWDEVPAPTITGSTALEAVSNFIAANGWNMETNQNPVFTMGATLKPIHGLPWTVIQNRDFEAMTHGGVLYVVFSCSHHNCNGVAYNPNTNSFAPVIQGFKPIGQHWYVWAQPDIQTPMEQEYEGQKK